MDIICSSRITVFLELCSPKTVRFLEQMSADKYARIFSLQMEPMFFFFTMPYKYVKRKRIFFLFYFFFLWERGEGGGGRARRGYVFNFISV